ncbi:hypothetical protein IP88_00785 [alpha proteobacterium AAP81b]|nr:hypothetical protein IP88_00785 [alpha proteobacterium AAP81b]
MTPLLLAWLAAAAAPDPGMVACRNAPTESVLARCWQGQRQQAEAAVDGAVARLIDRNRDDEPGLAEALSASQAAWRAWRDIQCRVDTWDSRLGTAAGVYLDQCLAGYARQRASHLAAMVAQP